MAPKEELKINVSFKKKEIELFKFLKSQRSPGNYIKDAVEFYRKYREGKLNLKEKEEQEKTPPQLVEENQNGGESPVNTNNLLNFD